MNKNMCSDLVSVFNVNGVEIDNKHEIGEHFNDYFASIGSKLAAMIPASSSKFSDYLQLLNTSSLTYLKLMLLK